MSKGNARIALALVCLLTAFSVPAAAEVVGFEIRERSDLLGGKSFGLAGAYEQIIGVVHFAFDPENDANRIITDIALAPQNADGKVEMSADFHLVRPKVMEKSRGTLLHEVNNRGRKGMLGYFNMAQGSLAPTTEAHFGDGFLMRHGFTLLWLGWQWDVPDDDPLRMRMHPPIATNPDGSAIEGLVRADFVVRSATDHHTLADRNHRPYRVKDPEDAVNVLTVRHRVEDEREVIPPEQWGFGRVHNGSVVPDDGAVYLKGGFQPHRIYEVVYRSHNPPLVGLGPAGIRDFVTLLRHDGSEELGIAAGDITSAISFGVSQSGRFLRTFMYYGFNGDEKGRRVLDAVIADVAGGGRGSFNHRFAQASRDAHPYMNMFHPTDIFPFTDVEQTDPETGLTAGLLTRQRESFYPRVFYTNSSYEYWGRAASLIHTTIDASEDARIPEHVRVYMYAGSQHGPAGFPPGVTIGQQRANPNNFRWGQRALLLAMDGWTRGGDAPPPSQYPSIEEGTAVAAENLGFPDIPGVETSDGVHYAYRADYGPDFATTGVVTQEPPIIGKRFPIRVSAVDEDGNEVAGIRMPEVAVPLATYTGWNLFNAESGPPDEVSSMVGSFVPFPKTAAEAQTAGDPRTSVSDRYASKEDYLGRFTEAALELIDAGYLLGEDLPALTRHALELWEHVTGETGTTDSQP